MLGLFGCETSGGPRSDFNVKSLPEYAKHQECLGRQAAIYSTAAGSPLELGVIASSACNFTRYALHDAIAKVNGRAYAQGYTGASETEDPKMIGGIIAKVKAGQKPFG